MPLTDDLLRSLAVRYHTPYYLFQEEVVRRQCRRLKAAIPYPDTVLRYACKALSIGAILRIIHEEGFKLDASSLNEVLRGVRAGFRGEEILYTGEGASPLAFRQLLDSGVAINCSSLDQVKLVGSLAPGTALSIRFNPGEGHGANNRVNTGGPASKHGIYFDQIDEVKRTLAEHRLHLRGVHAHIGSGTDLEHWLRIQNLTFDIARRFDDLEFIDLGGGLPVVYNPERDTAMPLEAWGARLSDGFGQFVAEYGKKLQLQLEPGRFIVAECGHLIAEVQNIKHTPGYSFAIVNTGFNHNPRPVMYGAFHPIRFISSDGRALTGRKEYVVAGYLCESGDMFTVEEGGVLAPRPFPELRVGDLMVMGNIGAYSHSMKSEYNSMNLPPSLLLETDGHVRVIERRGTFEDLVRREEEAYND